MISPVPGSSSAISSSVSSGRFALVAFASSDMTAIVRTGIATTSWGISRERSATLPRVTSRCRAASSSPRATCGFAPRSHLAFVAIGLGFAVTLIDLMAWFGWGARDTSIYVVAAQWLCVTTFVLVGVTAVTAVVEYGDVDTEERGLARIDEAAAIGALAIYGISAVLRSLELGQAAPSPAPF